MIEQFVANPNGAFNCDCWTAPTFVLAQGLIDTLKSGEFRDLGYTIYDIGSVDPGKGAFLGRLMRISPVSRHADMLDGDWAAFRNYANYDVSKGPWQAANVIKVSGNRFWSHGVGNASSQEIEELLMKNYNGPGMNTGGGLGFEGRINAFFDVVKIAKDVWKKRGGN